MAITRSTASERARSERSDPTRRVNRNLELLLLLLMTLLLVFGARLILNARAQELSAAEAEIAQKKLLNLNQLRGPDELVPALAFLEDPDDRSFAARAILQFLRDREQLDSVGELRTIQIPADRILKTRGLTLFPARLKDIRERGGAAPASIPLLTGSQWQRLRPALTVRTPHEFRRLVWIYVAVFLLAFLLLHAGWRFRNFGGDQLLLPPVLLLSGFGFLMMIRFRDPIREALLFSDFAAGIALGCIFAYLASLPDYEHSGLKRLAYIPLIASFALSAILIAFGSGPGVSDAKINLRLGSILVQPVEFIKFLLILFLAGFFASRWEFLRELRTPARTLPPLLRGLNLPRLRYAVPLALAIGLAIAFFFLERDLGPALVLTLVFLMLYAVARARLTGAVVALLVLIAAFGVGYELGVPRTVANRVGMWVSPWDNYISHGGDHLAQSFWSFSTGGLFGTGLGLGEPETVPAVHTDLILAAIGEELGFLGLLCAALAYAVLIHRALRISLAGRGSYSLFLGLGMTLLVALQVIFIAAGILGLAPLSGVVTPFMNYGKSSAIVNFLILGVLAALSANTVKQPNEAFRKQVRWAGMLLGILGIAALGQAARVQLLDADRFLGRGALVPQADGHRRYLYNGRILEAARRIPRGTIFDRNGVPLATSSREVLESFRAQYGQMNIDLDKVTAAGAWRIYPLGPVAFHILGDLPSRLNWGAQNTSFVERDQNTTLQGYDDRAIAVRVRDKPDGPEHTVLRRDFRELLPLVRYRLQPDNAKVREILERDRDVHLTIDARLQMKVTAILDKHVHSAGMKHGAIVVIDPSTGDLLASATVPFAGAARAAELVSGGDEIPEPSEIRDSLLDRARYGLYPPGSSFKLVTTIAALKALDKPDGITYECKRLPDGRVGNYVRGWGRPIRDDVMDVAPHGTVDLAKGLIVSCNAFFAQLGTYNIGAERLLQAADLFGIRVAAPNTAAKLKDALPQASYGQGQVVASPLQMARVAGSIGNGGRIMPSRWVIDAAEPTGQACLTPEQAQRVAGYMRRVVTEGTASVVKGAAVPVAGKTGTAELRDKPAHAWFVGFAPYGADATRIAFSIIIENGRYGGRVAAPAAAEIIDAALDAGLIKRE